MLLSVLLYVTRHDMSDMSDMSHAIGSMDLNGFDGFGGCLVQALLWGWGHQAAEATRQSVNFACAFVELRRKVISDATGKLLVWICYRFARLKQMRLENQAYLQRTQANSGFKLLSTKLLRSHFQSFSIEISFPSRCIRERHFFSFSVIAFFRL